VDPVSVASEHGEYRKRTVTSPVGKTESRTLPGMTETPNTPHVRDATITTVIGSASDTEETIGTIMTTARRGVLMTTGVIEVVLEMSEGRDGRVGRGLLGEGEMIIASAIEIETGRGIIVGSLIVCCHLKGAFLRHWMCLDEILEFTREDRGNRCNVVRNVVSRLSFALWLLRTLELRGLFNFIRH
jgi:hypothetical protein